MIAFVITVANRLAVSCLDLGQLRFVPLRRHDGIPHLEVAHFALTEGDDWFIGQEEAVVPAEQPFIGTHEIVVEAIDLAAPGLARSNQSSG